MSISYPSITISVARQQAGVLRLHCKVAGEVTDNDCANVAPMCNILMAQNDCFDVLLDMSQFQHCDLKLLYKKLKLAVQYRHLFRHVAIWGTDTWQVSIAALTARLQLTDMHFFEYRAEALSWLDEQA
ncbi:MULTISPECIES: STAS/SEC14 domain-containing protein [Shewanella]|uniref:STAS/SEC14 domain-containing protein n=1 Tax=Shewanella TaxID=22 RepID=UPI00048EE6D0|nr:MULTISPECIES: STAS/SEC14 domain-containing protein [Shewanella]